MAVEVRALNIRFFLVEYEAKELCESCIFDNLNLSVI